MHAFGLLKPTKTDNTNAVAVGEVLNGKYVVKAVEEDEYGRLQYRCSMVHGHEEVLVRCVGRKNNAGNASLAQLRRNKPGPSKAPNNDESGHLDHFEVQTGRDTLIYVVQGEPSHTFSASSRTEHPDNAKQHQSHNSDVEDPSAVEAPEQRPRPHGSRILIYKRGDGNLEVDIPPYGFGPDTVSMTIFSAFWIGFQCVWTIAVLVMAIAALDPMVLLMVLASVPFWITGFFLVRSTVRIGFTRENLIITPTNFRIKRTVEFSRRHRDSVNSAVQVGAELTRLNRIFFKQLEGATSELTATKKEVTDDNGHSWEVFVLRVGQKEHDLYSPLSDDERDWLLSEINRTLNEIRGRTPCSSKESRIV